MKDLSSIKAAKKRILELEKELKQIKKRHYKLFESAYDAIFTMDGETFIDCNTKTLELFGCKRKDIIGQPPYLFSPEFQTDKRTSKEKAIEKITAAFDGKPQLFEWTHKKLNGDLFDAEVSLNKIEIEGKPHLQAIVRDISERKKHVKELSNKNKEYSSLNEEYLAQNEELRVINDELKDNNNKIENEKEKTNAILKALPDILFILDNKGIFKYFHTNNSEILIVPPEKVIGTSISDMGFTEEKLKEILNAVKKSIKNKSVEPFEYNLKIGKTTTIWSANTYPLNKSEVVVLVRDITEIVENENELIKKNNEFSSLNEEYLAQNEELRTTNDELRDKNKKIKDSEEKYYKLFESANDSIFTMDGEIFIDCNTKTLELFDCKRKDIVGKPPYLFSPEFQPDKRASKEKAIEKITAAFDGHPQFFEWTHKKLNGELFNAEISLNKIELKGKKYLQAIVRDISEQEKARKKIKESEEKFRVAFETNPDSINISRLEDGLSKYVNKGFEKITGYSAKKTIGNNIQIIKIWKNQDDRKILVDELKKSGKVENMEAKFVHSNGKEIDVLISANIIMLNDEPHIIAITKDITDIKNNVEELMKAKEKAEESEKLKTAFLANMSHEIRTPMNGILGFTQLLKRRNVSEVKKAEYLDIISDRGYELLNIINDIIDISKIESKQVEVNHNNIELNSCIDELYDFFKTKKTHVKLIKKYSHESLHIKIDKTKFNQILTNLINNAIKFTLSGSVEIGYKIKQNKKSKYIEFFVKDTGIGVPANKQEIIFNRFTQADDGHTKSYGGTGLGLAISKSLVELMDGEIWVESIEKIGSTFYFTLPYLKSQEIENIDSEEESIKYNWNNKTILIAEDDEFNYLFLKEIINSTKAKIIRVKNGIEAIEQAKKSKIDIILMDIKMPKLDGISASIEIKKFNNNIPIIIQTAFSITKEINKTINENFETLISKPIDEDKLLSIINDYLA